MSGLRAYGIGIACAVLFGAVQGISAAAAMSTHPGWPSRGPNCAPIADTPDLFPAWLGHFTGGRFDGLPGYAAVLNWQDRYVCFPSLAACRSWQRDMRATFRQIEGYRTCLPIR
jgi:hypothetical protein